MLTRMTNDVNQLQAGINMVLRLFLRSPFIVFGAMIMAFFIDPTSALVFAGAIPVLAAVVFAIMLVCMPLYKKSQAKLDKVLLSTRENLTGARVLRAFCKEEDEKQLFSRRNGALTKSQKFVGGISALMNPLTYALINVAIVVLIYVGALRVNSGHISQGNVLALYNLMSQILVELIKLANLIITVTKSARAAAVSRACSSWKAPCSFFRPRILNRKSKRKGAEHSRPILPIRSILPILPLLSNSTT